ncbi:MAG TPA: di-trans,poly-cis-decaprenylcistransferase [Balneola sp.]|nr:di-trans,poly-cis-decaprenylcistransferase [Bacteroidota bacterium]MAC04648.1 di-trans,poly-cis-decaprenylcistransferase [Balneola sp.]MAO76813.1 di-trans,poly-cis-decaprenylcistransferase [Balneola sp.]MBF64970.1 di-trans,poly-cis-decaprenylcistransferase [Balneola sp.]HAH50498.1 di-trans,poly-cis-decaprenylcistransferase [Balneola sp.]
MKKLTLTNTEQTKADQEKQLELKKSGEIPEHIAIIMDGNGRWARSKGSIRLHGHKVGVDSVRDITESCAQLGVKYLTLYAFSTENWGRPSAEVRGLMRLLVSSLRKEADNLHENNIKLVTIGQTDRFPEDCKKQLKEAIELTEDNDRLQLCLALSYSGRWDITEAVKKIGNHVKEGRLDPTLINDQMITDHLSTAEVPDPDLIIRTSGEYRISNFLLWQLAYSELYITEQFWPDFRRDELYKAIDSYQSRDRRFGKVGPSEDEKGLAARLLKNKNK